MIFDKLLPSQLNMKNPQKVVNLSFMLMVLIFIVLSWREAIIINESYTESQRNKLLSVATTLDNRIQYSLDQLNFYQSIMVQALETPLVTDKTRAVQQRFDQIRQRTVWQVEVDLARGMPINGVSDAFRGQFPLLHRLPVGALHKELAAALEFSFILHLRDELKELQKRTYYISRSGFYVSSAPPQNHKEQIVSWRRMMTHNYFTNGQPSRNPQRKLTWTEVYNGILNEGPTITASVPIDLHAEWFGVIAMDFSTRDIHQYLSNSLPSQNDGTLLILDKKFNVIASTQPTAAAAALTPTECRRLASALANDDFGTLRMGTRFITYSALKNLDGTLVNVHSLSEGMRGEYGRIISVLLIMWLVFSCALLLAYQVILRLVRRMSDLQGNLAIRASYDTLTRLYNRGAFFEKAYAIVEKCRAINRPYSVIQIDLDHFKFVNDCYGHLTGDRTLATTARLVLGAVRQHDVVGRVGGEEFCVILPGTTKSVASQIAERIRASLEGAMILTDDNLPIGVTASLGVACADEDGSTALNDLRMIADRRLYTAKKNGRNQVISDDTPSTGA
ncbi:TPA: cellulose biosynthesis regulator diguanylate cyclase DgcQ [Serratia odorifera]|nr:cellulose biosynthesis regulator YedQ [Serratia odorifera]